jgi:hypothetical protein
LIAAERTLEAMKRVYIITLKHATAPATTDQHPTMGRDH